MKKTISLIAVILFVMLFWCNNVKAATGQALKDYCLSVHKVAGKEVNLNQTQRAQVENYFATHTVSDEQAAQVISKVDAILKSINDSGVTDFSKFTAAQKQDYMAKISDAAAVLNLKVTYDSSNVALIFYEDGKVVGVVSLTTSGLVQTGSTNIINVIFVSGIAVIASTFVLIVRKKKSRC